MVVVVDEEAVDVVTNVVLDRISVAGRVVFDCVVLVPVDNGCSQPGVLCSHLPSKLQVITTDVFVFGHLNSNSLPFWP